MKLRLTLLFCLLVPVIITSNAQVMTIGSYNLRYDNKNDTGNLWLNRAPVVASLLQFHDFDIFGTQEGLKNQLDDINKALPQYTYYGVGRDDGQNQGEHSAIFFKKDKFKLLNKGDFWLSETPDKPSLGWDALAASESAPGSIYRMCQLKRSFTFSMLTSTTRVL